MYIDDELCRIKNLINQDTSDCKIVRSNKKRKIKTNNIDEHIEECIDNYINKNLKIDYVTKLYRLKVALFNKGKVISQSTIGLNI